MSTSFVIAIFVVVVDVMISTQRMPHLLCNTLSPTSTEPPIPSKAHSDDPDSSLFNPSLDKLSDDAGTGKLEPQAMEKYSDLVKIQKDGKDPSHLLVVSLPNTTDLPFTQFIARVADVSNVVENRMRDANRTFLYVTSPQDSPLINIHGLNPGHEYKIAVLGRRALESTLIKEDSMVMDPVPLDFGTSLSSIHATSNNITLRANKPERALQDTFRVEYMQQNPPKRFPILDVHDIQDQKSVELYLGNLMPGRDYLVTVTSIKNDLPSQPWKSLITTTPLRPTDLFIHEINATCVLFSWTLPMESGADRFKIAYGPLHGPSNMIKTESVYTDQQRTQQKELCEGLIPGNTFVFAVIAEKSRHISEPATFSKILRPLPPRQIDVEADFERARFRIIVILPSDEDSHTEKCQITIDSEHQSKERIEQSVNVIRIPQKSSSSAEIFSSSNSNLSSNPFCVVFADLIPGKRFEISAIALSGAISSTKILLNRAIEPGFDFGSFGLTIREQEDALYVEWPQDMAMQERIAERWNKIVGTDSKLHLSLVSWPPKHGDISIRLESTPSTNALPMVVEPVVKGACYKILLYTVTGSSGIVSEQRFEQIIRMDPPQIEMVIGQINKHSVSVQFFLLNKTKRQQSVQQQKRVSEDCAVNVVVQEILSSNEDLAHKTVYENTLRLEGNLSHALKVDSLQPYSHYAVNAEIVCESSTNLPISSGPLGFKASASHRSQFCAPKIQKIHQLEFKTLADLPGSVRNLSARPINPYSAHLSWLAPEFPNGAISHYIIQMTPVEASIEINNLTSTKNLDQKEIAMNSTDSNKWKEPWIVTVSSPQLGISAFGSGKNLSSLGESSNNNIPVETVISNLIGGEFYAATVVAVNNAGSGEINNASSVLIQMPIMAPPRPFLRVEPVPNSVQSQSFGIQFNAGLLNEKHGHIWRIKVIVAEHSDLFAQNSSLSTEESEVSRVWGQVSHLDYWPPYITMELLPDPKLRHFPAKIFTESIGNDSSCSERGITICNGHLKPSRSYRVKLRLFTSPLLWTDTLYSDPITTGSINSSRNVEAKADDLI